MSLIAARRSPGALGRHRARVIWDSEVDKNGNVNSYNAIINGQGLSVVDDPAGILSSSPERSGLVRRVTRMETRDSYTHAGITTSVRVQAESPTVIDTKGDPYWYGFSFYLPAGSTQSEGEWFPTRLASGFFLTPAEVYGQPYEGQSGLHLGKKANHDGFVWQQGTYNWNITMEPIVTQTKGKWYDFLYRVVMGYDPGDAEVVTGGEPIGEVDVWMNEGSGWVKQPLGPDGSALNGTRSTSRYYTRTITPSMATGPWYHKIANYHTLDSSLCTSSSGVTIYHADHKIATSGELAAPKSYPHIWAL